MRKWKHKLKIQTFVLWLFCSPRRVLPCCRTVCPCTGVARAWTGLWRRGTVEVVDRLSRPSHNNSLSIRFSSTTSVLLTSLKFSLQLIKAATGKSLRGRDAVRKEKKRGKNGGKLWWCLHMRSRFFRRNEKLLQPTRYPTQITTDRKTRTEFELKCNTVLHHQYASSSVLTAM